ncbi:MAG: rRNA maturation RNase YbeY [Gammaproteobacteria bacterium]|nr:rRNA maturation RNase YbeY [Gammaproteobacteria bacterium]MCH9757188.1 rRNA maturation RNase YbeY [Gammaproteobacteria bacterium]
MTIQLDIQCACTNPLPVSNEQLTEWIHAALLPHREKAELTLRLVDLNEITNLNHTYRKQNKATNVLAFPSNLPDDILLDYPLLGDVVVCPAVLEKESIMLNTPLTAHWAHIVIHGVLHLLGYDHIDEEDARIMEALEIKALATLGFDNPYASEDN